MPLSSMAGSHSRLLVNAPSQTIYNLLVYCTVFEQRGFCPVERRVPPSQHHISGTPPASS